MPQTEINLRIRPNKLAVLISHNASYDDVLLSVRFLSRIWGGRHCPILPVNPSGEDQRAIRWLADTRPEFIFGLSVDDTAWNQVARTVCQHRVYQKLTGDVVESLHQPRKVKLTTVIPSLRNRRLNPGVGRRRRLQFVLAQREYSLAPYVSVVFGDSDPRWGSDTLALPSTEPPIWFKAEHTVTNFIEVITNSIHNNDESWLDMANDGLQLVIEGMHTPPTIVAVGSSIDLALAWNLRTATSHSGPSWVLPLPVESIDDQSNQEPLRAWLRTIKQYGYAPNFCELVSLSVCLRGFRRLP